MALRRIIRDALALDPLITMVSLEQVVEKKIKRPIDKEYLLKLVNKVRKQVVSEVERSTADNRVAEIRESYRTIIEELRRLAYAETTPPNEKRKCLDTIARIQDMQAKLEMDFGIFTRQIGTVNVDHRLKPIDPATLESITGTIGLWMKAVQMRKIEPQRVIEAQATNITTNEPKTQPTAESARPSTIPAVRNAGLVGTE